MIEHVGCLQDIEGEFPVLEATPEQALALWEAAEAALMDERSGEDAGGTEAEEEDANPARLLSQPKALLVLALGRLALSQACKPLSSPTTPPSLLKI